MLRIQPMLQLFIVTSKLGIVPLNKSITIPQLSLLGSFILSNLIRSVYNSLSAVIFIERIIFQKLIYFTLMD